MPNLDQLLISFGNEALPSFIRMMMALMALVGMVVIWSAMQGGYDYVSNQQGQRGDGNRGLSTFLIRGMIGGLMTVPAIVLWRAADVLLGGATSTQTNVLAYISGNVETGYCDNFVRVITLMFMAVGIVAIFYAAVSIDDKVKGFNPQGVRSAIPYFIGGIGCFFIQDIVVLVSNTAGVATGFPELCKVLGSP